MKANEYVSCSLLAIWLAALAAGITQQSSAQPIDLQAKQDGNESKGPAVHSVTGSSLLRFADAYGSVKIAPLVIHAFLYEDGTAGGAYSWLTFRGKGFTSKTKWGGGGEVISVTMYPDSPHGNAAVICGHEGEDSSLPNQYLVWFVVDNGQGGGATGPDMASEFVVSDSPDIAELTPEEIYAAFPYFYVNEAGNIDIK